MWDALAIALLAGAVIGCGDGGARGAATHEAAAQEMIAALDAGDADKLLALMLTPDQMRAHLACGPDELTDELYGQMREEVRRRAKGWKGTGVTLHRIEWTEPMARAPGDEWRGCKVQRAFTAQIADLYLRFQEGGETKDHDAFDFVAYQFDGRWFIVIAPDTPDQR